MSGLDVSMLDHINQMNLANIWRAILNLVDYIVVAALIFISFANILKIQVDTYAIKKIIPSLVLGVVLANLSWYICIIIIDFARVLVEWERSTLVSNMLEGSASKAYFDKFNSTGKDSSFLSMMFLTIFQPFFDDQFKISTNVSLISIIGIVGQQALSGIFLTGLGALLMMIMLILIVITYFMFIVRVGVLDFLIIVSPLAFLSIGFPITQKLFQQWWSQFSRWVFMAPLAFFMWVFAIIIGLQVQTLNNGVLGGFFKYVLMGGALYFAIKLPFMLGGGVMNAWGGLGAKLGKHAGKWANDKVFDVTKSGKFAGIQFAKPKDTGLNILGIYKGWNEDAEAKHQSKLIEGAGTGRDLREGVAGLLPRGARVAGKLIRGKSLNEIVGKDGNLKSALWQTSGRGAAISTNEYLKKGEMLARSNQDDTMILSHLKNAVEDNDFDSAREFMAAAATRRLDVDNKTKEDFNKIDPGFMRACIRQSQTANSNINNSGIAWAAMDPNVTKAKDDLVSLLHTEDAKDHGAGQIRALNNLNKADNKDINTWGTEQHAAYQFLFEKNQNGKLDSSLKPQFEQIAAKFRQGGVTDKAKINTENLYDQLDIDKDKTNKTLESQITILNNIKNKDILDDDDTSAVHFMSYIKGKRQDLFKNLGPAQKKIIDDALTKHPINPLLQITPKLRIKTTMGLSEIAKIPGYNNLTDDAMKKLSGLDILDSQGEINLKNDTHVKMATKISANKTEYEAALKEMLAKIPKGMKDVIAGENEEINLDRIQDINVNDIVNNQQTIMSKGITHKEILEHASVIEKVKSVKGKIDSFSEAGKNYQEEKENFKKFIGEEDKSSPPSAAQKWGGGQQPNP